VFRFAQTYYFYLFALIPVFTVLLILFLRWKKKALNRYGDRAVISRLMPDYAAAKTILKFVILMLAFSSLVIALARPQTGSRLEKVKRTGIDIVIALDVSNSMMAQDIRPNRLERAKQSIVRLIDNLEGDRIGIIVFAGKAYTQLPITTDYAAAKMFTTTITTGIVPAQGTAIADAIELAAGSFGESKHNKAIIIITDGEDHEGNVLEQTEAAAAKGITVYTIGMGLPEGAPIPVYNGEIQTGYKKDGDGNTVMSKLDETLLQRIATVGKGMYVRATNSETGLNKIFSDISKIQKSEIEEKQFSDYEDRFQYFVALALILLALDLFIFERKTGWMKRIKPFAVILFFFTLGLTTSGQKENKFLRQGNNQFEKGDFKTAEKDYRKALEINKESVKGQFNLGTAVYQEKNYEESARIYGGLAEKNTDPEVQSKIYHNLGNTLLQSKEYEKSISAYKNALMNNPKDLDTKYNLEYAKMMLKKQQEQQQQNKDQQKNEDKKDEKKDKQDQNQDKQNQDQNKNQNPDQKKISKDDADRMLEALKNDEKKTMQKVKKQQAKVQVVGVEKDW
jgi:Ca-activated chloride channel family protein